MFVRATQIESIEIPIGSPPSASTSMPPPATIPARRTHRSNSSVSGTSAAMPSTPGPSRPVPTRSATTSSRAASPIKTAPTPSRLQPTRLAAPTPLKRVAPNLPQSGTTPRAPSTPSALTRSFSFQSQISTNLSTAPRIAPHVPSTPETDIASPLARYSQLHQANEAPVEALDTRVPDNEVTTPPAEDLAPSLPQASPSRPIIDDSHELRVKLRVLENKRAEDAIEIRKLEARLEDVDKFVAIRPKLQAKLQSLTNENSKYKQEIAEQKAQISTLEVKIEEQADQLEMSMLDKEVAEERAEVAEAELEAEKEAKVEMEVELEMYRTGGATGTGDGTERPGRTEIDFRQLEKHNERLKEALVRLRDITHETETEHKKKIADLEKELAGLDDMHVQYSQTLARLEQADLQVEDLKQQLDDALGAEEMLMQLTERNLLMGEKIEEMRITIEDLEALRELNDELEETHMETERALQEDLSEKEHEVSELNRKIEILQEGIQDYEGTIQQFRELVTSLQSELDALRQQHQTRETESQAQASQSAAIMSLNMRLQSTAVKNQARNIDLELKKLDATQAREMLSIMQPYLPQAYLESDNDATNCYMFFQRLAFKADLINNAVASTYGLPESLNESISEALVGVCDMRGRIAHLSALCKRFAAVLRNCDGETFISAGRLYPELAPLEKRIDMHVDLLRRAEFREMECVTDVLKLLAQFEHLADTYFTSSEFDLGERELDFTLAADLDLDTVYAALGLVKSTLEAAVSDDEVTLELEDLDLNISLFDPIQKLLEDMKPVRFHSKKLFRRVDEVVSSGSALKVSLLQQITSLSGPIGRLVEFAIPLAETIGRYVAEVRSHKHAFNLPEVVNKVQETSRGLFGNTSHWDAVGEGIATTLQDILAILPLAQEAENVEKFTGVPPWVSRIEEVKLAASVNVDAERTAAKLNEEILTLVKGIKTRDQTIQESGVKIELMERRMETVKKQADVITDLENQLSKASKQEKAYEEAMDQLQADLDKLEQENIRLKQTASAPDRSVVGAPIADGGVQPIESTIETSLLLEQIEALRGAVRFLRSENSYLKGQDLLREIYSLPDLHDIAPVTPPLSPKAEEDPSVVKAVPSDPKPTLRSLTTESKLLYHDVLTFSANMRVVDLSAVNKRKAWISHKKTPAHQLWEQRMEADKLNRRVKGLVEKATNLAAIPHIRPLVAAI
ncbi:hypothetical protein FRC03_010211 [Tulasnella sp. 419]|nr:hypothetical protein FRC03_010211 [Tulasnella sp. 419]